MIETSDQIEPVYPAATVVLLRDGVEGLEALLVQRSLAVKHMGGMWVFPGGRVDEADYPADRDEFGAALNAAIRETEEEAGLHIRPDQLIYLSHWTTPRGAKKRFATWFFLAILDDGQQVRVDGGEIANHRWMCPDLACQEAASGGEELRMMPPTYVSLADIADYTNCQQASAAIGERRALVYEPLMVFVEDGVCFLYAGDAGYAGEDHEVEGPQHRFYMIDGNLQYVRSESVTVGAD
jgi:8-oxo-dGTP pyrophosphatase MutT (NUDIX family)